jgi:hypothetical protein
MATPPSGEAGGNNLGAVRAWGVTKPLIGGDELGRPPCASALLSIASSARSAERNSGRFTWRRSTSSWWWSTAIDVLRVLAS